MTVCTDSDISVQHRSVHVTDEPFTHTYTHTHTHTCVHTISLMHTHTHTRIYDNGYRRWSDTALRDMVAERFC